MILDTIAAAAKSRVERKKKGATLEAVREKAYAMPAGDMFPFERALSKPGISFICEVKKASPSKGVIAADFPYLQIARDYAAAGADAISVLTEPDYFLGKDEYLAEIKNQVSLPILRKDFVVDSYQIYEAKILGAAAVLLICAILDTQTIRSLLVLCRELGLSALVETHDEREMEAALEAQAEVIGVNNRNLKDFTVDINNSIRLRQLAPENILFVAESGIQTADHIEQLRQAKVDGVLIGEALMRSPDKKAALGLLRGVSL